MWIVRLALRRPYTFVVVAIFADYVLVIDAERTLLANQLLLAQTLNPQMGASVHLIKALGGGWKGLDQRNARRDGNTKVGESRSGR